MNTQILRGTVGVGAVLSLVLCSTPAKAYNFKTHVRMVEVAAELMQRPTQTTAPSGIEPGEWAAYLSAMSTAATKLSVLHSGLPNAGHENTFVCGYDKTDNMSKIPEIRIMDMKYLPLKGGRVLEGDDVEEGGACSETKIQCTDDNRLRLGRTLGWQAASADDRNNDTHLWYRPTSAAGVSAVNDAIGKGYSVAVGALLLPFVCIANLFSGDNCDLNGAENLADKYNPIQALQGSIPGFGDKSGYDYNGLWHFMDMADEGNGRFNANRGMLYESAGPDRIPGAIDVAIMIGADLTGLSLNADKSDGVSRFGRFDEFERSKPQWQATAIGHVEFTPVKHMAQYGWTRFVSKPTSAIGLSWPLHALGDAAEPHHAAGTTSWGHRPYEDEVDNKLDTQVLPAPKTCTLMSVVDKDTGMDPGQSAHILQIGFSFWKRYRGDFSNGNTPIQAMVEDVARRTKQIHDLLGRRGFNDAASVIYAGTDAASWDSAQQRAMDMFAAEIPTMKSMIDIGAGAMIAFLMGASQTAVDPGPNGEQFCAPPQGFDFNSATCVDNPPADVSFPLPGPVLCAGGGCFEPPTCTTGTCVTTADCPDLHTCVVGCCKSTVH